MIIKETLACDLYNWPATAKLAGNAETAVLHVLYAFLLKVYGSSCCGLVVEYMTRLDK